MILDIIVKDKKEELDVVKSRLPLKDLKSKVRDAAPGLDFAAALVHPDRVTIIAEVKKASPSKGLIRADFDPVAIAAAYEKNGAKAISVLTEKRHFMGDLSFLAEIRKKVNIPLLRKDFIFDEYQVYEAKANGADAFLLIAAILETSRMQDLYMLGKELGMETLAESHDERDLEKVLECGFKVVGINNRNLNTFDVDIKTTERLMRDIPNEKVIVSESGISSMDDMRYLKKIGADAALIGEAIMRQEDYGKKLRELADNSVSGKEQ